MIVDTTLIKKLVLDTGITAYKIEKETGVSRTMLANYRNGKADLDNMTISSAEKLQEYVNKNNYTGVD